MGSAEPTSDARQSLYENLHSGQLRAELARNEYSSRYILELLFQYYRPGSVLDVGCGLGTWLQTASQLGLTDIRGIDGNWLDTASLQVPPELVQKCDLETGFALGRRFDLAICLEVAEHIAEPHAENFIASLTRHAPVILFSAAIPFQGGHGHVNEQFLPYWVEKFAASNYRLLDIFRAELWQNSEILWWLRQNIVLFVEEDFLAGHEKLQHASLQKSGPYSLVHPDVYTARMQTQARLFNAIKDGGLFRVAMDQKTGSLRISKVEEQPAAPNPLGIAW